MYLYPIKFEIKYIFFLSFFLLGQLSLAAQLKEDLFFTKHYGKESGISQAVITDMVQDKTGFIWLSTYDGLNRFDGSNFTIFRDTPNDSIKDLPTHKVDKLFYDNNKHLWLYTQNGLKVFNIEKGQIENPKSIYNLNLQSLCADGSDNLWCYAQDKKLYIIDKNKLRIKFSSNPNDLILDNESVINLINTQTNIYLISTAGNIYTYNKKLKNWTKQFNLVSPEKNIKHNTATYDGKRTIFIGSMEYDLIEFDITTKAFTISPAHKDQTTLLGINDLVYDKKNNALLISTYGQGLFYYDVNKKKTFQYKQGESNLNLAANFPVSILLDRNDCIWLGYDGRGLNVLDPNIKKFTTIQNDSPFDNFSLKFVKKIIEDDDGTIWFATSGSGLVEYHRDSKKFAFYNNGILAPSASTFILEMTKVKNEIWLGLSGGGIAIFNIAQKKVTKILKATGAINSITDNNVWSLWYDTKRDVVWMGTKKHGLNSINTKDYTVKQYYSSRNPIFQENGMRVIVQTNQDELLIGSTKGLLRLNRRSDIFERIYPRSGEELNNGHYIKCIFHDEKERYWLGTDGSGITVLGPDYKFIKTIGTKDNLNNNVIYAILPQNDSSLWVSSNQGLSNIIFSERTFTNNEKIQVFNYNSQSGLQGNEFNTSSYAKLSDGSLAFGGLDGANIFKGEDIKPTEISSTIVITDFAVFNRKLDNSLLTPYLKNIDLDYNQNSFSLSYTAVGLTLPEKIKYRYRLLGYDENWVDAGDRTYVSYTNLSAGSYEFRVMASNYDGYWSNDYTKINIKITAPIYQRWWFILGSILILSLLIWGFLRNRKMQRTEKENMKIQYTKEIAEVEMKALRAQINPHFLFNSLNSINNFILKNDNINARKYLVKFSQLVRNILNNSTAPYVSLKEELDTLSLYIQIESMRFDNQFNYHVRLEKDLNAHSIKIPSLLLQPYIENAIWHGLIHKEGRKNIEIRIKKKATDLISIEIEDNGIGRKAAESLTSKANRRKSYGMQLGASRLKLMNSENQSQGEVSVIDLYHENNTARGTLIAITLPIIK